MKKLMVAVVAVCAAVGAFAETTDNYIQSGLIACWDGYENNGAGGHATELTEWKDTTGQYSFVFNGSGITVDGASLVFSGASGCYATLDATGTAATFDLAKDGTMEVVFKAADDRANTSFVLRSSKTSGIAAANYNSQTSWIVSNISGSSMPVLDGRGESTTLVVHYANGVASAPYVNGQPATTSGSNYWSGPQAITSLGANYDGTSRFKGVIYAIRLYSTQLTPEQIAANRAVDVKRFVEGNYNMLSDVSVQGFPRYATAAGVPKYGFFPCAADETFANAVPASFVEASGRRIDCLGWKLYDGATGALVAESGEQDKLKCEFTYSTPVRLVWQWKAYDMLTVRNFDDDLATVYVNGEPTTDGQKVAIDGPMTIELKDFRNDYYFRFAPETQTDRELAFDCWEGVPELQTTENPTTFTPEGDITITPNVDVKGYCWTPVTSSVIEDAILSMKFSKTDATRSVTTSGGNSNRVGVTENVLTFDAVERVRINDRNYTIKSFTGRPAFGNTHICQIALSPNFTTFGSTITDGSGFIITNLIGTAELKAPSYGWYSFYYGPAQLNGPVGNFISANAVDFSTGNAFQNKSGMKGSLVLNCVRSIASSTFSSCSGLTELYCPSPYLTTIDGSAFSGCTKLTKVTLGAEALTSVATSSFTANVTDFVFLSAAPDAAVVTAILSAQANVDGAHKATVRIDPAKAGWTDLIAEPTAAEIAAGLPRDCLGVYVDMDGKRKAWVCVSDTADGVAVEGSPDEYATDNVPAYGFASQTVGTELVFTAPDLVVVSDDSRAACAGWKLYDRVTGGLVAESTAENKTRCAFTYEKPVRLVWQWVPSYRIAPVAASGLSVSPAEIWTDGASEVAFSVSGTDYPAWTVNGVVQPGRLANITLDVTGPLAVSVAESRRIYVTQEGMGQKDGSSWGNAFDSIQAAIVAAGTDAATIFLLQGDYTRSAELSIAAGANLAFVGGCTGAGSEVGTVKSALIRDTSVASMRLVNVTGATASFSDMVIRGGRLNPASSYGHGVYGENAVLAFTRCDFDDNGVSAGTGAGHRGGGLAANGGSVKLNDCAFTKNAIVYNGGEVEQFGAGIWTKDAALEASGCLFATNYIHVQHFGSRGGAIYANGGSVLITNCVFNGNYVMHNRSYGAGSSRTANGGAIYFDAVPSATVVDSIFDGNYANNLHGGVTDYSGGTIYLAGAAGHAMIERCVVYRGGWWNGSRTEANVPNDSGAITIAAGTASVVNTLFADTHANAFEVAGGTLAIANVTIAGGDREPFLQKGGAITAVNAIIWGNQCASGSILDAVGGTFGISCSDVQGGFTGPGNFEADPLFADDVHCHPQSRAGRYDGGWFSGGTWVADDVDSPVIDAASASDAVGDELQPNGHRLNIGYDAGLTVASKTYLGEPAVPTALAMYIHPLVEPGEDAFTVEGEFGLAANGSATVTVYWGETDGGTVAANWEHNEVVGAFPDWTVVSKRLTDLEGKTFVRLKADDGESVEWSAARMFAPVSRATLSDVSITHLMRNTLKANGTLASDGGASTSVRFRYWTDDESQAVIVDYNYGSPVAAGTSFTIAVEGLEPGVTYHYAVEAVNSAGVRGDVQEVTTIATTDPITVYVTTTGAGIEDGSSWANAFSKFQDALDVCSCAGDSIYLAAGEYTVGQAHDVSELSRYFTFNAAGLTVNGDPAGGTVLLPGIAAARLFHTKNATVTFNDITFRGGRLNDADSYGHGFYGENSTLVFNRCTFDDNGVSAGQGDGHRGGGLAANGGSVKLNDCAFTNNRIDYNGSGGQYGAGIWAKNVTLEAAGCLFATNSVYVQHFGLWGGAIYATGGSALITNCVFNGNYASHLRNYNASSDRPANGGAIYFDAVPSAMIVDSTFDGNYVNNLHGGVTDYSGGTIYLAGAAGNTTIERCKILRGGRWGGSPTDANVKYDNGSICIAAGTAAVVNCLVTGMHSNAFEVAGGTLAITNVTVVGGDREPVLQKGGTLSVVNSILWDNVSETGVSFDLKGGTTEVSHSDVLGGFEGEGNIDKDPKFSTSKRAPVPYWLRTSSPCANAGDASGWTADDVDLLGHPRLRGRFVDMGCYECGSSGLLLMLK